MPPRTIWFRKTFWRKLLQQQLIDGGRDERSTLNAFNLRKMRREKGSAREGVVSQNSDSAALGDVGQEI
jgi:hypothetical protein